MMPKAMDRGHGRKGFEPSPHPARTPLILAFRDYLCQLGPTETHENKTILNWLGCKARTRKEMKELPLTW